MYTGFKKLKDILAIKGLNNPAGAVANIMRKKYKKSDIIKYQQAGTSMKSITPKKKFG